MNLKKLKAAMIMHNTNYQQIADKLGITAQALSSCLSNADGSSLKIGRAKIIADIIGLTNKEKLEIFFDEEFED